MVISLFPSLIELDILIQATFLKDTSRNYRHSVQDF